MSPESDKVSFVDYRERKGFGVKGLGVLWLITLAVVLAIRWSRPEAVQPILIEVQGDVPRPGLYSMLPPATIHGALAQAGAQPIGPDASLENGTRVVYHEGRVSLEAIRELIVAGLPIDVNKANADTLFTIPGLRRSQAEAIVAERLSGGPYRDLADIERARGVGPATIETLRNFVVVRPPEGELGPQ
jgi:competence protein ComEA